jgi:hypothetical protein
MDAFRYQLIDEPRPNILSKMALPPLLIFMLATFFQPWGYLLLVFNAVALNSQSRNSEIGWSLAPFPIYYGALALLDYFVRAETLTVNQAHYFFVVAVAAGLVCAAFAYISQARTYELRRYLAQPGGYG